MGVAYYIAVDQDDLDIISDIDGKSVAKAMEALTALATELGVPSLESFMGQSMDDMADLLDEDFEMEDDVDGEAVWFEPQEGIAVIDALLNALTVEPGRIKNAGRVIKDLESYKAALVAAENSGAKWHLAIDI